MSSAKNNTNGLVYCFIFMLWPGLSQEDRGQHIPWMVLKITTHKMRVVLFILHVLRVGYGLWKMTL